MGLFDKKKESQYELPAKLEMLLKMALEDGEVTEKELSVLRAEAAKHDISDDELDMIIASRMPKSKQKPKKAEAKTASEQALGSDEVNAAICNNLYATSNSVTETFQ